MRHFMRALIFAALGIGAASAVAQISTSEQQREEARYKEYLITTEVDYDGGVSVVVIKKSPSKECSYYRTRRSGKLLIRLL